MPYIRNSLWKKAKKALAFVEHIEDHFENMHECYIFLENMHECYIRLEVMCKICGKTIDAIESERRMNASLPLKAR